MKSKYLVRLVTFLSEHLIADSPEKSSLVGDLLEEMQSGRSAWWCWIQVLSAVAISWANQVYRQRFMLLFALLWVMPYPLLTFYAPRIHVYRSLTSTMVSFAFPWSVLLQLSTGLAFCVFYPWVGSLVYTMLSKENGLFSSKALTRSFSWSIVSQILAWLAMFILSYLITFHPIDKRTITITRLIFCAPSNVLRIPIILTFVVSSQILASTCRKQRLA